MSAPTAGAKVSAARCPKPITPAWSQPRTYKESSSSVGGDRLAPPIHFANGSFVLRRPSRGLAIPLDDRLDAYHELLYPPDQAEAGTTTPIGRDFIKDDENAVPRPAAPGSSDPDLVGRGHRAHKRTRNALAAHLKSLGIRPLDPVSSDPPLTSHGRLEAFSTSPR
jgi:hypothetical protein